MSPFLIDLTMVFVFCHPCWIQKYFILPVITAMISYYLSNYYILLKTFHWNIDADIGKTIIPLSPLHNMNEHWNRRIHFQEQFWYRVQWHLGAGLFLRFFLGSHGKEMEGISLSISDTTSYVKKSHFLFGMNPNSAQCHAPKSKSMLLNQHYQRFLQLLTLLIICWILKLIGNPLPT